jgi:DNA-directed RNA polymerase subunit RPC12/RpoP
MINTDPKLYKEQEQLFKRVVEQAKVNITTCPDCGSIVLVDRTKDIDKIKCPYCHIEDDYSMFGDIFC